MTGRGTTKRLVIIGGLAAAVLFVWSGAAFAQSDAQRCEGTVVDHEGNPLKGVEITFLRIDQNRYAQPVKTSKKGRYAHNVLTASTAPGYEIKASLEGYKMVQITALTQNGNGTKATDETYRVGSDQSVHQVSLVAQGRASATSQGKCVIDFVMVPEELYTQVFHKLSPAAADEEVAEGEAADAPAAPVPAAPQARDPLEQGRSLIAERNYAAAIEPLREAVEDDPEDAEALRLLGDALLQTDNMAEAETVLNQAAAIDPETLGLNFDMGMLYTKKGRLMQAIPYFEKELELTPGSESILHNLSQLYIQTEQYDKAVESLEEEIALNPDNLEHYGSLADAYKHLGDTAKEREVYQRMGAQDPSGMAFYNLGNIMFNNSEMQKAADAYKKAIEQSPKNANAHYQLGLTYVNLGKFGEAAEALEAFVKLSPKDPKAGEAKSLAAELKKMGG